ncbi:MAG: HAD-IIB family hydrolase, partial [Planctomycetota bacterium]
MHDSRRGRRAARKEPQAVADTTPRLIAIDLDGTLLDADGVVPERNRRALHAAHEAGLKLVLCTGRTFTETRDVIEQIGLDLDATVTIGGALISEAMTGRTLERVEIEAELSRECVRWLQARDYAVIVTHDVQQHGFDGYVIDGRRCHDGMKRWLKWTRCEMRVLFDVDVLDGSLLRISVVDDLDTVRETVDEFAAAFGDRLSHNVIHVASSGFTILEAFHRDVTKWTAIERLCRRWRIDPRATVAIGDDVNDAVAFRFALFLLIDQSRA